MRNVAAIQLTIFYFIQAQYCLFYKSVIYTVKNKRLNFISSFRCDFITSGVIFIFPDISSNRLLSLRCYYMSTSRHNCQNLEEAGGKTLPNPTLLEANVYFFLHQEFFRFSSHFHSRVALPVSKSYRIDSTYLINDEVHVVGTNGRQRVITPVFLF